MTACSQCRFDPDAAVTARWSFFLPVAVRSSNELHLKSGARWKYTKIRDEYALLIRNAKNRLAISEATGVRRLTLCRIYTGRGKLMDDANFRAGCKPIVDCIAREKLLRDDSPRWLEDYYRQRRDAHLSGVEVVIEELEAA